MAYYIKPEEELNEAYRRIALEQIEKGLTSIEKESRPEAVHDVRKRCKKLRGLARLYRFSLGEENYKKVNIYFRDLARKLSDIRDAKTMLDTMEMLSSGGKFSELEETLKLNRKGKKVLKYERDDVLEVAKKEMEEGRAVIEESVMHIENDSDLMIPALKKTYMRGQKALASARESNSGKDYHELRKRVKYLWYATRIIKHSWHNVLKKVAQEWSQLSDDLGDDHDLVVLREFAAENVYRDEDSQKNLTLEIEEKSREFRQHAHRLVERLFWEKPRPYAERMIGYLNMR